MAPSGVGSWTRRRVEHQNTERDTIQGPYTARSKGQKRLVGKQTPCRYSVQRSNMHAMARRIHHTHSHNCLSWHLVHMVEYDECPLRGK